MRVVYMGFQTWGHACLEALLRSEDHEVPLVVTHPESSHPYETIWSDSVAELARAHGVAVHTGYDAAEPACMAAIQAVAADVVLCSDWRRWVAPETLALARLGGINIHDGLLPEYGGFAPINWAVARGEREAGLTAHWMTEELDGGDILVQRRVPIGPNDTATDVVRRIFALLGPVALEALAAAERPGFRAAPQDRTKATFFHKRSERDSRIDWRRPAKTVYDLIRAQSDPYPNAFAFYEGERFAVKRASLPDTAYCGAPGRIFCRLDRGVVVVAGRGDGSANESVVLEVVQPDGRPPIQAKDYFRKVGSYVT